MLDVQETVRVVSGYRLSIKKFAKRLGVEEGDLLLAKMVDGHLEITPAEVVAR